MLLPFQLPGSSNGWMCSITPCTSSNMLFDRLLKRECETNAFKSQKKLNNESDQTATSTTNTNKSNKLHAGGEI